MPFSHPAYNPSYMLCMDSFPGHEEPHKYSLFTAKTSNTVVHRTCKYMGNVHQH